MKLILFQALIFTLLSQLTSALFEGSPLITQSKSFQQFHDLIYSSDYLSVLLICSSRSPKCKEIDSDYAKLAETAKSWAEFYGIDCDTLDRKEAEEFVICSESKVDDYPLLVFFEPKYDEEGKKDLVEHIYEGVFDIDSLEEFGLERIPSFIDTIKDKEELEEFLNKRGKLNSVLYFTEDTDIPSSYKVLSSEYKDRIKVLERLS